MFCQIKDGQYTEAIKVLHGTPESSSTRAGLSLLAYCYFYSQDFVNAAGYYEQLSQMFPQNDDYRLYYAQAQYQACKYDEAYRITEDIQTESYAMQVKQSSGSKDQNSKVRSQIRKLQAAIKYGEEDLASAKKLVDSCAADDADTEVNLGCLLYKVGSRREPRGCQVCVPLLTLFQEGNYEEALNKFLDLLQYVGFRPYLSYNAALCYYKLKEYGPALKHCGE